MCTEKQKAEEESSNSSSPKHDDSNILLRNVSGLIFFIWLLYLTCAPRIIPGFKCLVYWLLPHGLLYDEKGDINWGTLGDYFGALNCLFAGLAFAAVYVSIKQQSKAIQIQQNELKAQLKEAKEQNELQREYQFSDEFYRRLVLLKTIEKDILYQKDSGAKATVGVASTICNIIGSILNNKLTEASDIFKNNSHDIFLSIDKFCVWGNSFLLLANDVYSHFARLAALELKSLKKDDIKGKKDVLINAAKNIKHYRSILIESCIWSEHFLLLIIYSSSNEGDIGTLKKLEINKSFARGRIAKFGKDERYQFLFKHLFKNPDVNDVDKHISDVYAEFQIFKRDNKL